MRNNRELDGQLTLLKLDGPEDTIVHPRRNPRPKPEADLIAIPFLYLDLSPDHVNLFGKHYWEILIPYREGKILSVQSRLPGNLAACGGTR